MCPAARPRRKRSSMASCCCSGKSAAPEISSGEAGMAQDLNELAKEIAAALPGAVKSTAVERGELVVDIEAGEVVRVMKALREQFAFQILVDLCGVDWPRPEERFDVVYHLLSLSGNPRIPVKLPSGGGDTDPTMLQSGRCTSGVHGHRLC